MPDDYTELREALGLLSTMLGREELSYGDAEIDASRIVLNAAPALLAEVDELRIDHDRLARIVADVEAACDCAAQFSWECGDTEAMMNVAGVRAILRGDTT